MPVETAGPHEHMQVAFGEGGVDAAAAKDNIKLLYSSDPNAGNQANLVQDAIDQKVDGIAITLAKPHAMKSVIAKANAAGIPVVGLESRCDGMKKTVKGKLETPYVNGTGMPSVKSTISEAAEGLLDRRGGHPHRSRRAHRRRRREGCR